MQDILDKADNVPGLTGELPAAEFNDHKNELQEAVEKTGQALTIAKTPFQLPRALFINGVASQSFQDSGTGDGIVLTPITGISGLVVADAYSQMDGAFFQFKKTTPNTSSAVVVNFGQDTGSLLGAKDLKRADGTDPLPGEIFGEMKIRFDVGNDYWVIFREIITTGFKTGVEVFDDSGTLKVKPGRFEYVDGNGNIMEIVIETETNVVNESTVGNSFLYYVYFDGTNIIVDNSHRVTIPANDRDLFNSVVNATNVEIDFNKTKNNYTIVSTSFRILGGIVKDGSGNWIDTRKVNFFAGRECSGENDHGAFDRDIKGRQWVYIWGFEQGIADIALTSTARDFPISFQSTNTQLFVTPSYLGSKSSAPPPADHTNFPNYAGQIAIGYLRLSLTGDDIQVRWDKTDGANFNVLSYYGFDLIANSIFVL